MFRDLLGNGCVTELFKAPVFDNLTLCSAGIQPIVTYEVFVFLRDMLRQLGDKIACFEEFNVLLPVFVILRRVNNRPVGSCIEDLL